MRTDRSFMISITQICNKVNNCSKNEENKVSTWSYKKSPYSRKKIAAYLNDQNRTNKYVHKTYGKMG